MLDGSSARDKSVLGVGVNIWMPDRGSSAIAKLVALGWEVWWPTRGLSLIGGRVVSWLSEPNNWALNAPGVPSRPLLTGWPVTGSACLYFDGTRSLECNVAGALALINSAGAGRHRWLGGRWHEQAALANTDVIGSIGALGPNSRWRYSRAIGPAQDYGAFRNTAGNTAFPIGASINNAQSVWLYSTPALTGIWRDLASLSTAAYPAPDGSLASNRIRVFGTIDYGSAVGYCGAVLLSGTDMSARIPATQTILTSAGYV